MGYLNLSIFLLLFPSLKSDSGILDLSTLNHKVVGIMLKTNGRRYYVSSELCPGGIFLPKPVDENCLCYNGIFQVVRKCCGAESTRIDAESLEWRMDYKCGLSTSRDDGIGVKPIRAILPVTKAYNRLGSVIMAHSLKGQNISQWHKFDIDDIIVRNRGEVKLRGRMSFEIVNVKPIGRPIKIWFGKKADIAVCYNGWHVGSPNNLRIHLSDTSKMTDDEMETTDCCFEVDAGNTPGEVQADCSNAKITTELVEISSADIDIGKCDQEVPEEAIHKIQKRQPDSYLFDSDSPFIEKSRSVDEDPIGDAGHTALKDQLSPLKEEPLINVRYIRQTTKDQSTLKAIIPRKKGIAAADLISQQRAINEFVSVIRNDPEAAILPPKTFRFSLLKKSVDVFLAVIPDDIVPHIMLKTAFDIFYYIYESLEAVTYDPPEIHGRVLGYLDKCLQSSKPINFSTFGCPRQIDEVVLTPEIESRLKSFYKDKPQELQMKMEDLKHVEIKQNKRFIPELYDIYVDINWKIVDFVHSFCFDFFAEEFNAHHFFERELEQLFLYREVQRRWFERRKEGLKYVKGIFPVLQLELRMKQIDKVAAVGHHLSRYNGTYWLYRPKIDPFSARPQGLRSRMGSGVFDEKRNVFAKGLMEASETETEGANTKKKLGLLGRKFGSHLTSTSDEREVKYPFQVLDKLPAGELIWDGLAVCLHASYSTKRGYFHNPSTWGMTPSLIKLGKLYPLNT